MDAILLEVVDALTLEFCWWSMTARLGERHGTTWPHEEERELREAYLAGATLSELAARHQRSRQAIRKRLEHLGLLDPRAVEKQGARKSIRASETLETSACDTSIDDELSIPGAIPTPGIPPDRAEVPSTSTSPSDPVVGRNLHQLVHRIDALISTLTKLRADAKLGKLPGRTLGPVAAAYEGLETDLLATPDEATLAEEVPADDPSPDQLRAELRQVVRACVPKLRDRYVAIRALGLSGDGKPWTLASMGVVLGVTRERVRQLRERAFEYINENLARRLASASRLRAALTKGPSSTDYRDPEATVALVVKYVTSHFAAAKQLTIMCCKAAGNHGSKLEDLAGLAAAKACSKPELLGKWRLDRWKDAAERAIGPFDTSKLRLTI